MRSLQEQISGKCIHFTGTVNKKCEKDITYDSVRDKTVRPFKMPCLSYHGMNGSECKHCEFPSPESVKKQVEEIEQSTKDMLARYKMVKDHYKATKERVGIVECSKCKGDLHYEVHENGHIWAKCDDCSIGWME